MEILGYREQWVPQAFLLPLSVCAAGLNTRRAFILQHYIPSGGHKEAAQQWERQDVWEGSGFAPVLLTALVDVRGKFSFCVTVKQGDVWFPCHTGSLWLIPKANQFPWFLVSRSDPDTVLPARFPHARCEQGWERSPVWDRNNLDQWCPKPFDRCSPCQTEHGVWATATCWGIPVMSGHRSQGEAKSLHWGYHTCHLQGLPWVTVPPRCVAQLEIMSPGLTSH